MGEFDLNLSTRPFPAYKLKTVLLTVGAIVLIALSSWQAYSFMQYTSLANHIRGEARAGEVEAQSLSRRNGELDSTLNRPEVMAKLNEIEFFNDIILRKALSWTRLFSTLESLTPENIHLTSLRPIFEKDGGIILHFEVTAHGMTDVKNFIEALQSSIMFSDVIPTHEIKKTSPGPPGSGPLNPGLINAAMNDMDVSLNAKYHPEREGQ